MGYPLFFKLCTDLNPTKRPFGRLVTFAQDTKEDWLAAGANSGSESLHQL